MDLRSSISISTKERYYLVSGIAGSTTDEHLFFRWEIATKGNGISPELISRVKLEVTKKYDNIKDIYIRVDSIVDQLEDEMSRLII